MANKYVRQGAAGSGSGADWTNAYTDLPSSLTRGDVYYIADGTYNSYTFDDAVSGTTVTTIKKATISSHGTNTGWIDTYGDGTSTFTGDLNFATDYWLLDGVTRNESDWTEQVYGFHCVGTIVMTWALNFPPGANNITVQYFDVGSAVGSVYPSIIGEGFYIVNNDAISSNFTVSRCFIHNCTLMQVAGISGVTVEYCYFKDMWAKEAIRGQSTAKNGIIRYCIFKNTNRDTGLPGEAGTAPIAIWDGDTAGDFDNWDIYGNIFLDTVTIEHSGGVIVVGGDGVGWVGVLSNNVKIYNNTVIGLSSGQSSIWINGGIGTGTGNEIRNTLWYNCVNNPAAHPDTSSNLVSQSDPFVNLASDNFHLSTPLVGTSLGATYNTDLDGNIRGSDGVWDIGAMEYVSSSGSVRAIHFLKRGVNNRLLFKGVRTRVLTR